MKAPAFWYRPRGIAAYALAPLGLLWRGGTAIRRLSARPWKAKKPVICIGNLVAGGAGKTPTALAVANILQQNDNIPVFVTRGYGGQLRGPLQADPDRHSVYDIGDEALLLSCAAPTFVGRDRAAAIREAERHGTHVILDDGLQNPHVRPDIGLLVIDGETGFGNGLLIPAGPLRETLGEVLPRVKAAIIIGEDEHNIAKRLSCPVLRARWQAELPLEFPQVSEFFAFAGIAHPAKFYATCREAGLSLAGTRDFPDHHIFSEAELEELGEAALEAGARLLTTEKDWVRLPRAFRMQVTALPARLVFEDLAAVKRVLGV